MILILTCINSNHQTFILFLAFLPSPGVQGLDKIYNVKLIHLKKVDFAWIAFQIFQIRCIRRPKSIQSKRQKRRIRTIFGRSRACNQADREAVQGRIWQKDLFVSRSGVGKKWNDASPSLSLHQGEAARKLRPPRPWPPMHLAALCTVRCADRPPAIQTLATYQYLSAVFDMI